MNISELSKNIIYTPEDNWSVVSATTDVWPGELPYHTGMEFPTHEIKERARISHTNRLIYENDVDRIYTNIISVFPEIDPMYGWQIREIVSNLPYFKNATNAWVGLIAGDSPLVDVGEADETKLSSLLENSNLLETLQNEVRSRFLDIISAYRVDIDIKGRPVIVPINTRNLVVFVDKNYTNSIEVCVVFNIYTDEKGEFIEFIEYHYDGVIIKRKFYYANGTIGEELEDEYQEDMAFNGQYKESPVVVFKHNTVNGEIYGTDQYRYWSSSMLAGMREFQNVLRLGERTREFIRKVPSSAIKKQEDGSSVFFNKGTISYNENAEKFPDVEYVVPEIRMQEAIEALDKAINQIAIDTQLGVAFFNLDKLGSRLSAESIRAAMYPARLEAQKMVSEIRPSLKELVIKIGYLAGIEINSANLSIEFFDGFPKDEKQDIEAVQLRLESKVPSITLVDAIMRLDKVPLRIAKQKAREIQMENKTAFEDEIEVENIDNEQGNDELNTSEIQFTAGRNKKQDTQYVDDTIWENQMYPRPRDIPQGISKGVKEIWQQKRLRERDL